MNKNTVLDDDILYLAAYSGTAFLILFILLLIFFYYSFKKINKIEIQQKNHEIQHQKEIVKSIINTQEAERKRIAQDLHDDISSKLNIISFNTHLLLTQNLSEIEKKDIKNTIITYTKLVIDDSRRIAHDLLPPVFQNFGLQEALSELCSDLSIRERLIINYNNQCNFETVSVVNQLHIFRIIQELINNSIVHGKASEIYINFTEHNNVIKLVFSDNGKGFNPNENKIKRGIGTKNIESRVSVLEGTLKVTSEQNLGVKYIIEFSTDEKN